MARRNMRMEEYLELVYQWHRGRSIRQIRDSLQISRKTIRKYLLLFMASGLSREKPLPPQAELARIVASVVQVAVFEQPARERIRLYHRQIQDWLGQPHMTIQQVQRLLEEEHELKVSYMSVYRYVREHIEPLRKPVTVRLHAVAGEQAQVDFGYAGLMRDPETGKQRKAWAFIMILSYSRHRYVREHIEPLRKPVTVRLHAVAGEQAQVDFGYAGLMRDPETGKQRKAWAFIMILSYSRHRFVRFVFRQDSPTWLDCHIRAFTFFQACPRLIVLDNLKDGVLKPDLYDPTLNPAYAELERHYGFVADPAKVQMARHKGRVERCVPVVRQQILAGRHFRDIEEANGRALEWCLKEVGLRKHGTTHRKPYEVFVGEEVELLLPLPDQPYEAAQWKQCTVHWDCHLILDKCYYSVPYPYRGERLWVRADLKLVRVYRNHQLIKTHLRVFEPGSCQTQTGDYPPDKRAYLERTPEWCRRQADELGPEVSRYVRRVLGDHAMRNLRKAQAVLRLAESHPAATLDQACRRALRFDNVRFSSLKKILEKGLFRRPSPPRRPSSPAASACRFARPQDYFVHRREVS